MDMDGEGITTDIGNQTKEKLIKQLKQCKHLNNDLETENEKKEDKNRFATCNLDSTTISKEGCKRLQGVIEENKSTLTNIEGLYFKLSKLGGCGKVTSPRSSHSDTSSSVLPSSCECAKFKKLIEDLLKLLSENRTLCSKLKNNVEGIEVEQKYLPVPASVVPSSDTVSADMIRNLVRDNIKELDKILRNSTNLWCRGTSEARDSGYRSGSSQTESELASCMGPLSITEERLTNESARYCQRRRPSATEHEDNAQTLVKYL